MIAEGSGRAHLIVETVRSRLHVLRRLADEWLRFQVKSKWPGQHFIEGKPSWVAISTSISIERSEEGDYGGK